MAAFKHRHQCYLAPAFDDLPPDPDAALDALLDRISDRMATETSHGCLFHAAVAADPGSARLRELLTRHKAEVARKASEAADLPEAENALLLIIEGLTKTWPLHGHAVEGHAQSMARALRITRE
ncbi:TetR/AcrR family transcriptional regulator [Aliiruegeria sabulilitoris]|uniref:TetR/AcrR family transcriptional regulator n=1 Tax=Aliiruegeria sabulilitoris TaxID=1510458 RepID=UPI0012E3F985|nr:TetR/AcrR family transcriptional regulator [Aliiruegeria sabulilitoris]NDR56337.1 TetR/AcrR family transcriptional regulator [Pseudoruegeria sp. M32A2M]